MKIYKSIIAGAILAIGFTSCESLLDVTNPNYITDDQMAEYMATNEKAEELVLTGLVGSLPSYINIYNAALNGGYSNSSAYESNFEFRRFCQSGDVVEGSEATQGSFSKWYQNSPSNTYWRTEIDSDNYGYYLGPVYKYGAAQHALDFLTEDKMEKYPSLRAYRGQGLTMKALAYTLLMERYTDLQDVTSTTKQGWPIYDAYAYNAAKAPLSVAETWKWINDAFAEAVELYHNGTYGNKGYTIGNTQNDLNDIDCGVCQYYRCRAALDSKEWDIVIEAAKDLLEHYPSFMPAANYGMNQSLAATVIKREGVDATHPGGTKWATKGFNAEDNGFFNSEKNPEAIWGSYRGSNIFWSLDGLNALKAGPSGYYQVDKGIYDKLSDNDCRKACILAEDTPGMFVYSSSADTTWYNYTMPKYTSLKWAATEGIDTPATSSHHTNQYATADNIYLRSAAVVLALAEAYAQKGDDANAKATLDKLLAARSLDAGSPMTCANSMAGMSVLDMVKLQWRIEMWGEGDWAFFNQKRWGEAFVRGGNHWNKNGVPANGWTWEIPQKERQGNPYWN